MSVDQVVAFVQGVGFPVAVAAYLLWDRLTIMTRLLGILGRIERHMDAKAKRDSDTVKAVR